jgi:hypothetical protein
METAGPSRTRFEAPVAGYQTTWRHITELLLVTAVRTLTHTDYDAVPVDSSKTRGIKLAFWKIASIEFSGLL